MSKESAFYFIDKLGILKLICDVLPAMWQAIRCRRRCVLFCMEATPLARWVTSHVLKVVGIEYRDFNFRLMDIKDEDGSLVWLKVLYFDFNKVFKHVLRQQDFQDILARYGGNSRGGNFLLRKPMVIRTANEKRFGRSLFFMRVAQWAMRQRIDGPTLAEIHVFVAFPSALWHKAIHAYGQTLGILVEPLTCTTINIKWMLRNNHLSGWIRHAMYGFYARYKCLNMLEPRAGGPALMVEYYGQLNLKNPQYYCDLFFHRPDILGKFKTFLTFNLPNSPLDKDILDQIGDRDIEPLVLNPKATRVCQGSFYQDRNFWAGVFRCLTALDTNSRERLIFRDATDYWQQLFEKTGTKVYLSWFKYSEEHMAIADGIRNSGGTAAIYQRAFEEFGSVEFMVDTDIVFGFSPWHFQVEQQAQSRMAYHVAVGYIGDHRFALVKDQAKHIRSRLQDCGATRIMAYFDENSLDDERWYYGHGPTRTNYTFLLEKVLVDEEFGLVLKPKVPSTLGRRLGPVGVLLEKALQTGRCFIFESGSMHGVYPPVAAAQCADIAVHGHLFAATAAVESALAGVPTLVLDIEGWKGSMFYQLKKGQVVFDNWPQLWEMCVKFWNDPKKTPGLGDWREVLNDIDPFRDGRAAERMATYVAWLLQGFQEKLSREEVMARAAERYARQWGKDKIHAG